MQADHKGQRGGPRDASHAGQPQGPDHQGLAPGWRGRTTMKVRISRDELLVGLQRVQGVVEKRNTMPILSNILVEAKADGLDIVATDLEIGMRGLYKATVQEPGSVTLSARKLYEILKELPDGEIEMSVGENKW